MFFNKSKSVTYRGDIWLAAEKYFSKIEELLMTPTTGKYHVKDDMYLLSNIFSETERRYTGIHAFYLNGAIAPHSGVNLDDREWSSLMKNFRVIKNHISGKDVDMDKVIEFEPFSKETVKMFVADWVQDGDILPFSYPLKPFFFREEAMKHGYRKKPVEGKDYQKEDGEPELRVRAVRNSPPDDIHLMYAVFLHVVQAEVDHTLKKRCEGCRIDSGSQSDHCMSGGCLDTDDSYLRAVIGEALVDIGFMALLPVFDVVRREMGLRPTNGKQLACAAVAWISHDELTERLLNPAWKEDMLRCYVDDVVRRLTKE